MPKIILSRAAGEANPYLRLKRPSSYIPFKGDFPLLDQSLNGLFSEWMEKTDDLTECPGWMQEIIFKGMKISRMEKSFIDYLKDQGVFESFLSLKSADKSTHLIKFLNSNSMDIKALNIG